MGFTEAIRTVMIKKYATFSGRASRSEYWWFQLFYWLLLIVLVGTSAFLAGAFSSGQVTSFEYAIYVPAGIFMLVFLIPVIAVQVRRFHDRNLSGWWYLAALILGNIPFIGVVIWIGVLVVSVLKGTDGPNRFGPDPLRPEASAEVFA